METPLPLRPLLFEEFLAHLRRQGLTIGVDHHLRLQELLSKIGSQCAPGDLKTILCPIFATDANQQKLFCRLFDSYFGIFSQPAASEISSTSRRPQEKEKPAGRRGQKTWKRRWPYFLLAVELVAGVLIFAFLTPRQGTEKMPAAGVFVFTDPPGATVLADGAPVGGLTPTGFPLSVGSHTLVISKSGYPPIQRQVAVSANKTTSVEIDFSAQGPVPELPRVQSEGLVQRHNRAIRLAVVVVIPLFLFLSYEWFCLIRRRLVLQRKRGKRPPFSWPIQPEASPSEIYDSTEFYGAARRLQRRQVGESYHMDIEATVQATVDSLGYPRFQYKPDRKLPEYLVLVDRASFRDHQANLFHDLVRALRDEGLYVSLFFFEGDPRVCWDEEHDDTVHLFELQRRYAGQRLLLLSDAEKLIDPLSGNLAAWSSLLLEWKDRGVLTPEPLSQWGLREKALATQFIVLPATTDGLFALGDYFELPLQADISGIQRTSADHAPPEPDDLRGIEALRTYLGAETFQWLAACAVYPELHWDLTLYLGSLPCLGRGLVTEGNLIKLTRLPWFRRGFMPDELRWVLIQELGQEREKAVREAVVDLLEKNPAPRETHASDAQQLEILFQRYWLDRQNTKKHGDLLRALRSMPDDEVAQNYTLLRSVESLSKSRLDIILPSRLRRMLFPSGLSALGLRTSVRLVATLALIGGILILYYRNPSVPVTPPPGPNLSIEQQAQQEKTLFNQAKAAEEAKNWGEAIAQYTKVVEMNGAKKSDAQQHIQQIRDNNAKEIAKNETETFQQASRALLKKDYSQAQHLFLNVIGMKVPDSTLAPKAQAELDKIEPILRDKTEFDAAAGTQTRGDLPSALRQFQAIADKPGTYQAEAKARIPKLNLMINNAGAQKEYDDALQLAKTDPQGALVKFRAIAGGSGPFKSDAQTQVQQINDQISAAEAQQQFDAAVKTQNSGDLPGALAQFKALAGKPGPKQSEANQHAQQIADQIAQAQAKQQLDTAEQAYKSNDLKGALKQFQAIASKTGPNQALAQARVDLITQLLKPAPPAPTPTPPNPTAPGSTRTPALRPCGNTTGYLQPAEPFQRFALIASLEPLLAPQTISGTIRGTVCDAKGGILSGASVIATNTETGRTYSGVTDTTQGMYVISEVPPGLYLVRAQLKGFQPQEHGSVRVDINRVNEEDFVLKLLNSGPTTPTTMPPRNPVITLILSGDLEPYPLPWHKGVMVADNNVDGGLKPLNLTLPPVQGAPPGSQVLVMINIDESGNVAPDRLVTDTCGCGPQVREAARSWKFAPPTAKGKPVKSTVTVKVAF